jgi:hypothetical protein
MLLGSKYFTATVAAAATLAASATAAHELAPLAGLYGPPIGPHLHKSRRSEHLDRSRPSGRSITSFKFKPAALQSEIDKVVHCFPAVLVGDQTEALSWLLPQFQVITAT